MMILRDYQSFSAANAIRSLIAMHPPTERVRKPVRRPGARTRRFDPFWAEKDDVDEDGSTDNPDWLIGAD